MRVFVLDPVSPRTLAHLATAAEVTDWRDPAAAQWREHADGVIVRLTSVTADDIARARRLKVVGKHGVGVDNIDVAAARAKGITVVNTPGANAYAVAELVLGLALVAARHVIRGDHAMRASGAWRETLPMGRELKGCRLGIIGLGNVGRAVSALFAGALHCHVSAYDPFIPEEAFRARGAAPIASLDALLAASDIVTLHVPLTELTRGMVRARELALLPDGAILINAARGGIVDEGDLAAALARNRPAAAAVDAFVVEPPSRDHPLLKLPNFIATPHLGGETAETLERVGLAVADQVLEVLAGRPPKHAIGAPAHAMR